MLYINDMTLNSIKEQGARAGRMIGELIIRSAVFAAAFVFANVAAQWSRDIACFVVMWCTLHVCMFTWMYATRKGDAYERIAPFMHITRYGLVTALVLRLVVHHI